MERLSDYQKAQKWLEGYEWDNDRDADDNLATICEALQEIEKYKDLEGQGKLLKLPCTVGDTVYVIEVDEENFTHFYCPRKISEYKFNLQMIDLLGMFGKCIFLTREEAEVALKQTERGKGK